MPTTIINDKDLSEKLSNLAGIAVSASNLVTNVTSKDATSKQNTRCKLLIGQAVIEMNDLLDAIKAYINQP